MNSKSKFTPSQATPAYTNLGTHSLLTLHHESSSDATIQQCIVLI